MINEIKLHYYHFSLLLIVIIVLLHFNYFLLKIKKYEFLPIEENIVEGIVVLTGDKYRISEGLSLLEKKIGNKLLISGVNSKIPLNVIKNEFPKYDELFNCCIEFDNTSSNTFENIREVYVWKLNNDINTILIVSSDYHLPRVELESNRLLLKEETHYYGVEYKSQKINIRMKKLIVEYVKYLRTKVSLSIGLY